MSKERMVFTRPEVPNIAYELTAVRSLLSSEEGQETFSEVVRSVIDDALSPEGPQWAHGLTDDELNQPLDINTLLDSIEQVLDQSRQPEIRLSADAFEMRFDDPS